MIQRIKNHLLKPVLPQRGYPGVPSQNLSSRRRASSRQYSGGARYSTRSAWWPVHNCPGYGGNNYAYGDNSGNFSATQKNTRFPCSILFYLKYLRVCAEYLFCASRKSGYLNRILSDNSAMGGSWFLSRREFPREMNYCPKQTRQSGNRHFFIGERRNAWDNGKTRTERKYGSLPSNIFGPCIAGLSIIPWTPIRNEPGRVSAVIRTHFPKFVISFSIGHDTKNFRYFSGWFSKNIHELLRFHINRTGKRPEIFFR